MSKLTEQIIRLIEQDAAKKVSKLSGEYIRAKSDEKEAILAAIETERWVSDSCNECLEDTS